MPTRSLSSPASTLSAAERRQAEAALSSLVPEEQWAVYAPVLRGARERGLRFAVGGGLAFSLYSRHPRNTKDMDIFIVEDDHQEFLRLMKEAGFTEYTAVPYDPTWSYRGQRQGYIMDLLWRMLNDRAPFDEIWTARGWDLEIRGVPVKLLPPEELIWTKIYILGRERCDWPDILEIVQARGTTLDWAHLLERLGPDAPLLGAVLSLFRWLCPGRAADLPVWLWPAVGLATENPLGAPPVVPERAALLNGHDWFQGHGVSA